MKPAIMIFFWTFYFYRQKPPVRKEFCVSVGNNFPQFKFWLSCKDLCRLAWMAKVFYIPNIVLFLNPFLLRGMNIWTLCKTNLGKYASANSAFRLAEANIQRGNLL